MLSGSNPLQLHAGSLVALLASRSQSFTVGFKQRPTLLLRPLPILGALFAAHGGPISTEVCSLLFPQLHQPRLELRIRSAIPLLMGQRKLGLVQGALVHLMLELLCLLPCELIAIALYLRRCRRLARWLERAGLWPLIEQ